MKKTLLALIGVAALSTVAFAQNNGTTTTSVTCNGTNNCTVQGQTLLQAIKPEGLTLTVPNEIDFTIVNGMLNIGNKPLTATVSWDLTKANAGGSNYSNVTATAWLASDDALTSTDGLGSVIPSVDLVGQVGNNGPQTPFDGTAGSFANPDTNVTSPFVFPIFEVPPTTNSADGGVTGQFSADLNLYIDSRTDTFPALDAPFVYQGMVYVTASAF